MHTVVIALGLWVAVSVIVSPFIGQYVHRATSRQRLDAVVGERPARGTTVMSEQADARVSRAAKPARRPALRR